MKKFSFSLTFILIWLWLLVVLGPGAFLGYASATLLHELGHYLTAKKLGYKLSKFSLSAYGVSLSYFDEKIDFKEEVIIALAGPLTNIMSAIFVCGIWWIFPTTYFFTSQFVFCSVVLGLINLLPAYPLDGGRIFTNISHSLLKEQTSKKITFFFNLMMIILFSTLFVLSCFKDFNPTLLLFSIFLVGGLVEFKNATSYEKINIFHKPKKNFSKTEVLSVNADTKLSELVKKITSSKTTIFYLQTEKGKTIFLSEKLILKLILNYPSSTTLFDIFKSNFPSKKI